MRTISDPGTRRQGPSFRSAAGGYIAVIVLFAVVMLSSAIAGQPQFEAAPPRPLPTAAGPSPAPSISPGVPAVPDRNDTVVAVIGAVLGLLLLAVLVAGAVLLARSLHRQWQNRPPRRHAGAQTDGALAGELLADEAAEAPRMQRGIAAARESIRTRSDPADAIVAAWVGLEETAADSGRGRGLSETPAEFTLRILLRRPGIDEPAQRLLRLYEGVRFGARRGSEQMRAEAVDALTRIEEGWR